ncbi:MAG: LicD family protein [Verrucomicrobia bacterium]|nr:LicD family protein [Verrucomicrobiota bacterium]
MLDKFVNGFIYFGLPVVAAYHALTGNIFLNVAAEDASGLEYLGNAALTPVQYLLNGKVAIREGDNYVLEQKFDYHNHLPLKSTLSFLSLPISLSVGTLLKAAAYFTEETRRHHEQIASAQNSRSVKPNIDYYRSVGLPISDTAASIDSPEHKRRPCDENKLASEKALLKEISQILKSNQIPFWLDCGSCLGAYRYGGLIPWDWDIDVAILAKDHDNVMHALKALDPAKYQVQDWSNRIRPKTYIRVYNRETRNHLDLYHFAIDSKTKTLASILSNEESSFMVESWKIRERRFTIPTSYDIIFPLRAAKFDGIDVFVPNQTKKYLQQRYGENIGPVRIYNETTGIYEKDESHPYWQLPHASG